MVLKAVFLDEPGSIEHINEDGKSIQVYHPPKLGSIHVCDKCGYVHAPNGVPPDHVDEG
jgi:hypothetical protein